MQRVTNKMLLLCLSGVGTEIIYQKWHPYILPFISRVSISPYLESGGWWEVLQSNRLYSTSVKGGGDEQSLCYNGLLFRIFCARLFKNSVPTAWQIVCSICNNPFLLLLFVGSSLYRGCRNVAENRERWWCDYSSQEKSFCMLFCHIIKIYIFFIWNQQHGKKFVMQHRHITLNESQI